MHKIKCIFNKTCFCCKDFIKIVICLGKCNQCQDRTPTLDVFSIFKICKRLIADMQYNAECKDMCGDSINLPCGPASNAYKVS